MKEISNDDSFLGCDRFRQTQDTSVLTKLKISRKSPLKSCRVWQNPESPKYGIFGGSGFSRYVLEPFLPKEHFGTFAVKNSTFFEDSGRGSPWKKVCLCNCTIFFIEINISHNQRAKCWTYVVSLVFDINDEYILLV